MTKMVKMCDMSKYVAAEALRSLNSQSVQLRECEPLGLVIITDRRPTDLLYPEGWYYSHGNFTNKLTSTTGKYQTVIFLKSNGDFWE